MKKSTTQQIFGALGAASQIVHAEQQASDGNAVIPQPLPNLLPELPRPDPGNLRARRPTYQAPFIVLAAQERRESSDGTDEEIKQETSGSFRR